MFADARHKCRPHLLTIIVVLIVSALIVLANLSSESNWSEAFGAKSFGWPIVWHRFVVILTGWFQQGTVGWYFSAGRLAVNVVLWLAMLAVTGFGCEWLLRRYRPRFRWSLRAMLAVVAVAGAFCAWLATALDQAAVQDEIIGAMSSFQNQNSAKVKRWGPRWLDVLGFDRLRRQIVEAEIGSIQNEREAEQLFAQLARLRKLRCLSFNIHQFTPAIAASLNRMQNLERLEIGQGWYVDPSREELLSWAEAVPSLPGLTRVRELVVWDFRINSHTLQALSSLRSLSFASPDNVDKQTLHECLAGIGGVPQLDHLDLSSMTVESKSLACLAGLTNLKTLCLDGVRVTDSRSLRFLPRLPRLESLHLSGEEFCDADLLDLSRYANLKSLALLETSVTAKGLEALGSLESLEELAIAGDLESSCVSTDALRSLQVLKRLRKLHLARSRCRGREGTVWANVSLDGGQRLQVLNNDISGFQEAMQALRKGRPGIVIEGHMHTSFIYWNIWDDEIRESGEESYPNRSSSFLPTSDAPWLTMAERATFKSEAGWARFDAAGTRLGDGRTVTVSF